MIRPNLRLEPAHRDGWEESALCRQSDPELWWPLGQGDSAPEAKAICRRCPVRLPCLLLAVEHTEREGVWGGFNGRALRKITRENAADMIVLDKEHAARRDRLAAEAAARAATRGAAYKWRLRCHAAYNAGKRDEETLAGEREYNRMRKRQSQGAA